jgi:hypothetical protein
MVPPGIDQHRLEGLRECIRILRQEGVDAAAVVAAFHRRRLLPLMDRPLYMWEMRSSADLHGTRMSSGTLSGEALMRRIRDALGTNAPEVPPAIPMRPSPGYIALVSVILS